MGCLEELIYVNQEKQPNRHSITRSSTGLRELSIEISPSSRQVILFLLCVDAFASFITGHEERKAGLEAFFLDISSTGVFRAKAKTGKARLPLSEH